MAIYTIADLHLSFNENKPMDIFGNNWNGHTEKIKENWLKKVEVSDTVILPGDFSWSMYLEDTVKDFEYLNSLPGRKILLKGNHDYWWTTITSMNKFVEENHFENINFLLNNSYLVEDKIICGTRGWAITDTENSSKMIKRECNRLELSILYGIEKFGNDKEIIVFMHYPPILKQNLQENKMTDFMKMLKKYNVKRCYYGHLHSTSINDAVEGEVFGVNLKLVSADSLNFNLEDVR